MDLSLDVATAALKRFLVDPLETALDIDELDEDINDKLLLLSHVSGDMLLQLFRSTGNPEHLTQSIDIFNKALQRIDTGIDPAERVTVLLKLGDALFQRHLHLGRTDDIDGSIHAFRDALIHSSDEYQDRRSIVHGLGSSLSARFEIFGDTKDIDEAIDSQQQAVDLTPEDDQVVLPAYLVNLGVSLSRRFELMNNPDDVHRAVQVQRRAVQLLPLDSPDLPAVLTNLGTSLTNEFSISNDLSFINEAIAVRRDAINLAPETHPNLSQFLCNVADSLFNRSKVTKDIQDIDEAIGIQRNGILLATDSHPKHLHMLNCFALFLCRRFKLLKNVDDLEESLALRTRIVAHTPPSHSSYASRLAGLADCYCERYDNSMQYSDLKECIILRGRVMSLTPPYLPAFPVRSSELALAIRKQYDITGDLGELYEVVELHRQAASHTTPADKNYASYLANLGNALATRYSKSQEPDDLEESIAILQEAAKFFSPTSSELPHLLTKLGGAFVMRYSITNERWNLDEGIAVLERAMDADPPADDENSLRLPMLGLALASRFRDFADIGDIDSAIMLFRRSVEAYQNNNSLQYYPMSYLGRAYLQRYKMSSDINDVHNAVSTFYRAVNISQESKGNPPRIMGVAGRAFNDAEHPTGLHDLGDALLQRYIISADVRDISDTIAAYEKAVSIASLREDFKTLSESLVRLGSTLGMRYSATYDPADIDRSLEIHRKALDIIPDGDASLPHTLISYGDALGDVFKINRDVEALNEAIRVQSQAIEIAHGIDSNLQMATAWNNIGVSFIRRFRALGHSQDLEESINARQKALDLTPQNDAEYPARVSSVADSLMCKYDITKEESVLRRAYELMKEAALFPGGSPSVKMKAARHWAIISENGNIFAPEEILHAYDVIFELMPLTVWLGQTVYQRHQILEMVGDIVNISAGHAFSLGRFDKALEWLEQGRSVVWNQIGALRSPIEDLASVNKDLAEKFLYVSRQLEEAGTRNVGALKGHQNPDTISLGIEFSEDDITGKHHLLAQRMDELVQKIRRVPGFENFMRPTRYKEIKGYVPANGIVVVLNEHDGGYDALILRNPTDINLGDIDVQHLVPHVLPKISGKIAEQLKSRLELWKGRSMRGDELNDVKIERAGKVAGTISAFNSDMDSILRDLWELIVEPIIQVLQLKPTENPTQRLWWCPTGPLSFLPIHAAGNYSPNSKLGSRVSDYVVSSYIPTISTLRRLRKDSTSTRLNALVAVSQSDTPGMSAIPSTEIEIEHIKTLFQTSEIDVKTLQREDATVAAIAQAMKTRNWLHLACHGTQHRVDPLQSAFYVHDGLLTLSEIMQLDIPNADFAFLSACQTSTGHEKLPDEAVHLAAGMLSAGYRSVVATMWSISDSFAPDFVLDFYKYMFEHRNEKGELNSSNAALALNHCTRMIVAQKHDQDNWDWVPFIHIGL